MPVILLIIIIYLGLGCLSLLYMILNEKVFKSLVEDNEGEIWKIIVAILIILIVALQLWPVYAVMTLNEKTGLKNWGNAKKAERRMIGLVYGKDNDKKKDYEKLRFWKMGGAGEFQCLKCGHREYVVSFLHGAETGPHAWHKSGYQCQRCGKITTIGKDLWLEKIPFCDCGGQLSKKEPLFCPVCKSFHVEYRLSIIT